MYLLFAYIDAAQYEKAHHISLKLQAIFSRDHDNGLAASLVEKFQINDTHHWATLDNKKQLKLLIDEYRQNYTQDSIACYPKTFVYPDERQDFLKEHQNNPETLWIVKPSSLYGGQHISIIDNPESLPKSGEWVIQRYIDNPLLAVDRKFGIRLYLLIDTKLPAQFYLYKNAGARFAPSKYSLDKNTLTELSKHITQTELFRDRPDLIDSASKELNEKTPVWLLSKLFQHLSDHGYDTNQLQKNLHNLANDVTKLIRHSGLIEKFSPADHSCAYQAKILGLDVQVDADLNVHLLEIERYPGSAGRYKVDKKNGLLSRRILNRTLTPFLDHTIDYSGLSKSDFEIYLRAQQTTYDDEFDLIL